MLLFKPDLVDFNVSTDKKTIYLKNEKQFEEALKGAVENTLSKNQNFTSMKETQILSNGLLNTQGATKEQFNTPGATKGLFNTPGATKGQFNTSGATKGQSYTSGAAKGPCSDQLITNKFKKYDPQKEVFKMFQQVESLKNFDRTRKLPKPISFNEPKTLEDASLNINPVKMNEIVSSSPKIVLDVHDRKADNSFLSSQRVENELDDCPDEFISDVDQHILSSSSSFVKDFGHKLMEKVENVHSMCKSDLKNMSINGQFNLGFIITCFNNNLYIVDQHAADEKYNFERIYQSISSNSQKLLAPKIMDLDDIDFQIFLEHKEAFERFGFRFKIDGFRVGIVALPLFQGKMFMDREDIIEFVSHIRHTDCNEDNSHFFSTSLTSVSQHHNIIKSEKLYSMVASKACRSSVMIGTALKREKMKEIVHRLSSLEKPWSCPHGRPTIRHLASL
ncbi:Mismatch repair endonuclease pms1 [Thelohanellus kitauei]|uniref:Mismatch repair endonuclease pms1 n=1 Tax=Thelohanellus kitauei TaxID=669202 RepID=A0A0C2N8T1_THEKT|nr:Mismatch repair endonuclease pms1 [Thelohanellus kitauei]